MCIRDSYYIGLDETRDSLRETIRLLDALSALAKLYRSYIAVSYTHLDVYKRQLEAP